MHAGNWACLTGLSAEESERRSSGMFFVSLEPVCDFHDEIFLTPSDFPNVRRTAEWGSPIFCMANDGDCLEFCMEATSERSDSTNTLTSVNFLQNEGKRLKLPVEFLILR